MKYSILLFLFVSIICQAQGLKISGTITTNASADAFSYIGKFCTVNGTTGIQIVDTGTDGFRIYDPTPTNGRIPGTAVIYVHGLNEDHYALESDGRKSAFTEYILQNGYLIATNIAPLSFTPVQGGVAYGNPISVDCYYQLCQYLINNYGVTKIVLWGQSIGGFPACTLIAQKRVSQIKGFAGIYPLLNLAADYPNSDIDAAYVITGTIPNTYVLKTAGYDPVLQSGSNFAGIRMRFYSSLGDGTAVQAINSGTMNTIVTGWATETNIVQCSGDHGDPSHFQPADFVAFLQRCFQ